MEFSDFFVFEKFLTPKLVTIVYWIGLFFIAVSALGIMLGGSWLSSLETSYGMYNTNISIASVILAAIYAGILALFWRVSCEMMVVIFSINDRLGTLVELGGRSSADASSDLRA